MRAHRRTLAAVSPVLFADAWRAVLAQAAAQGFTARQVADALGRNPAHVRANARRLGVRLRHGSARADRYWRPILEQAAAEGRTTRDVALAHGRDERWLQLLARRLGIAIATPRRRTVADWRPILEQAAAEGGTLDQVAEAHGRHLAHIRRMCQLHGIDLPRRPGNERPPGKDWPAILAAHVGRPLKVVAHELGVSQAWLKRLSARHGIRLGRNWRRREQAGPAGDAQRQHLALQVWTEGRR